MTIEYRVFWYRPPSINFDDSDYDVGVFQYGRRSKILEDSIPYDKKREIARKDMLVRTGVDRQKLIS